MAGDLGRDQPARGPRFLGESAAYENMPLTVTRNGFEEQTWLTFSYTPIRNEAGEVAGLFCACRETTDKVLADRRLAFQMEFSDRLRTLSDPHVVQVAAAETIGRHLQVARAGYGEIDASEEVVTVYRDWTDGTVASLGGEARLLDGFGPAVIAELRAGHTLRVDGCLTDPRSMGETYAATWASIGTRSLVAVPLIKDGRFRAILYLHEPAPRRWTSTEIALAEDAAQRTWEAVERARIEERLRDSEARLRLAIDAGRMAVWEWDAATNSIQGSPELNRILGFPPGHVPKREETQARYYPGEHARLQAAGQAALARGERYFEVEFRYGWPGPPRWLLLRAEFILDGGGAPSGVVGVLLDMTDRRNAEEALQQRERELKAALGAASLGTYVYDHVTGELKSSGLNVIYGYPEDHELTLADLRARYHPDDLERLGRIFGEALDPSVSQFEMEFRLRFPDGTVRWVYGKGEYVRDADGLRSSRGVVMDVSDRKKWEEHQQLLINELNHRVKNTLATVQSIVSQTLRNATTAHDAKDALESRLFALSRAHDVLTRENWEGASLYEIVAQAVEPYSSRGEDRLHLSGPDVRLSPRMALALAMALQELATNAVKYGALSNGGGEILITWAVDRARARPRLPLCWEERGGPPVEPPKRRGFGSRLIERTLAQDLDGEVRIDFAATGVVCRVDAPTE
ncbi:HWE histidine kinase domain-containing protein [Microvirga aerophila]|nr:HWE histidine kinase domain-containing protein [Microvirga aerophila]